MSRVARNRANLAAFAGVLAALSLAVAWFGPSGAGAAASGELVVQPSLGAPADVFLGASPQEAPGEAWATARDAAGTLSLARYSDANGWDKVSTPLPPDLLSFFVRDGATAGRATPRGGVAVAAEGEDSSFEQVELVLIRDPGGSPRLAEEPTALLEEQFESSLFGPSTEPTLLAASDEAGGRTGAYVVPESRRRVLHYDGDNWSSEQICMDAAPGCTEPLFSFQAYGIDSSGGEAWLVGTGGAVGAGIELFHREAGTWRPQPLGPVNSLGARLAQEEPGGAGITVKPRRQGQPLTVTSAGVWFDFRLETGGSAEDATAYFDAGQDQVTGSWCDSIAALCPLPLGADLPNGDGRSFAWPPGGSSGPFGTRAITGVGAGAILSLDGSAFRRLTFVGGDAGSRQGAALSSPEEGWLGASPPLQLTRAPQASRLQSWPVPFRRPLTAIAGEPGKGPGALGAGALAVGMGGQVARYVPGVGWEPEFLLRGSGKRATPTLRGVAWPEPGLAYAVGDGAAMWRWQKATGLWQPDPGAPASLARANFTGIAFDPAQPSRGYAVGKQGVLLGFGREWKQEALPAGIPAEANFSSISFAGGEAIATWKFPKSDSAYSGGVIVNDGSGWRVDSGAQEALGGAIPQRVAGLPDGGAAIATLGAGEGQQVSGRVIVRQGAGGSWQATPGGLTGFPTALAAVREGGTVRALVSVAGQSPGEHGSDREQIFNQPPPGQAPLLTAPYALPASGALLRQTPSGWRDEQRQQYPLPAHASGQVLYDLPVRSDPVLALLIAPDGSDGWAVGGDTASNVEFLSSQVQTAAVMRYGSAAAPPSNASTAPIPASEGAATFAIGGHARCAAPCADFAGAGIGPDRWLPNAVSRAAGVPGVRAFVYTGGSVAPNLGNPSSEVPLAKSIAGSAFQREEEAYARRLGAGAGSLPVFAAPSQTDLDAASSLSTFQAVFDGFGPPFGAAAPGPGIAPVSAADPGKAYYSFDSSGAGGAVRVIVLDYSSPALGEAQQCWLAQELAAARSSSRPAIVVGERDLAGLAPNAAADRVPVVRTLVGLESPCPLPGPQGAASAYFFDFPEENRAYRLNAGGRSLSTFGSGTLGYVEPPPSAKNDFAGASGFLVVSVEVDERDPATNVAPVGVKLVPAIGSLALDATDGTLLRRSQPALFEGLARRALAGSQCEGSVNAPGRCEKLSPPPYVPIPSRCQGANCATSVFPEYTFSSSEPDIADFVAADPTSSNPRNVLLVKKKPVLDSHSGLLCAFNAGTTIVTVTTGGLSYSQKVTVQAGTVQQPCGTTPLRNRQGISDEPAAPPAPAPTPESGPLPNDTPPPPPPPPASAQPQPSPPVQKATPPTPPTPISYFPVVAPTAVPLVPIVPPPPLPAVQPTPPSGTSQVNAVEEEEEPEEATESSSAFAALPEPGPANVSLRQRDSGGGVPLLIPVVVLVAAIAAAGIGGRRRDPRPAFQTTSTKHHTNRRYR